MNKKQIKRIYNVVIIAALVVFIGLVCSRFVHWGNVEYTDDAQVWRHITPINARVGGFIKEVRFDEPVWVDSSRKCVSTIISM